MTSDNTHATEANGGPAQDPGNAAPLPAWLSALCLAAALLPILQLGLLIHRYAIPVPYKDEWALARLMIHANQHAVTFQDLWTQHNEHRMLFPNLVFLGLAQFGGWNAARECWASLIVTVCSFCLIADLARRTVGARAAYPLCVALSWLMFSPMQWENFVIGFQLQWPLTVLAFVFCIWSLAVWRGRTRGLVCGMIGAALASVSMAGGLMTWFIGLAYLFAESQWTRLHKIIWICAAAICAAAFMHGFDWTPAAHVDRGYWHHHPVVLAHYVTFYLGSPVLFVGHWLASVVGVAGITAYAYFGVVWFRKRTAALPYSGAESAARNAILVWLMIAAFGLLNALTTGVGRCGLGVGQGGSSRYLTIANTLWIGVIGAGWLTACRSRRPFSRRSVYAAVAGGLAVVLVYLHWSVPNGYRQVALMTGGLKPGVQSLPSYKTAPDADLRLLYPDPSALREMCAALDRNHIWPFDH